MKLSETAVLNMALYNMALKPGETLLVLTDVPNLAQWGGTDALLDEMIERARFARRVFAILRDGLTQNKIAFASYYSTGQSGTEPVQEAASLLCEYDVSVIMTTFSISHTNSREKACQAGRRIASMPGIEASMFAENAPMSADYGVVARESERYARLLSDASSVHLVTPSGTDLRFSINGRQGGADTGIFANPGEWGNLPGGEAFVAPVEGSAEGQLVVPRGWYPDLQEDMTLLFRAGYVVELTGGGAVGHYFRDLLFAQDGARHRGNCAELGIGTNPLASRADNVLEAEKIRGTVHIAIGDSSHMGGVNESDLHEDFILPSPTLTLDQHPVAIL